MKNLYLLSKVRVCCCCLMSFELSAFANCYINLQKCLSLSLCACACARENARVCVFVCVVCVCVCVCVTESTECAWVCACVSVRMRENALFQFSFLDPGLYKNVKQFRYILGLLLFWTNETKNNNFHCVVNLTPRTLTVIFLTPLQNNRIKPRLFACLDALFRNVTESHALR